MTLRDLLTRALGPDAPDALLDLEFGEQTLAERMKNPRRVAGAKGMAMVTSAYVEDGRTVLELRLDVDANIAWSS